MWAILTRAGRLWKKKEVIIMIILILKRLITDFQPWFHTQNNCSKRPSFLFISALWMLYIYIWTLFFFFSSTQWPWKYVKFKPLASSFCCILTFAAATPLLLRYIFAHIQSGNKYLPYLLLIVILIWFRSDYFIDRGRGEGDSQNAKLTTPRASNTLDPFPLVIAWITKLESW